MCTEEAHLKIIQMFYEKTEDSASSISQESISWFPTFPKSCIYLTERQSKWEDQQTLEANDLFRL